MEIPIIPFESSPNAINFVTSDQYHSCPIDNCFKKFKEKGNLIIHIRVHVSSYIIISIFRQEISHLSANIIIAVKDFLPKVI